MSKKICVNARFLTQSITGVQRYAIELVKALDKLLDTGAIDSGMYSFELLAPKGIKNHISLKHISIKQVGFFSGHLWEQLELPFYARGCLLMNLCNAGPMIKRNQTVTIHDAAVFGFPRAYSLAFRSWYRILLSVLSKRAYTVITDSNFSKREIEKYCMINENKIQVIYIGREHILSVNSDRKILVKHNLVGKRYIFAVSSMSLNKNFHSIVNALEYLNLEGFEVVIAGGVNPKIFNQSYKSLPAHVNYVGYVSDEELRALYENAACFIFPSFYEGFGLPPLEAMACGCPVLVSNTASLPEVCGEAALYFVPDEPKDIANTIKKLINNQHLEAELREKGLSRANLFSWEICAKQTFDRIKPRKKIYINARFLTQSITGVQRYSFELVRALDRLIDNNEIDTGQYTIELLAPNVKHLHDLRLKNIPIRKVGCLSGHAWEQLELPFYSKGGLLFSPGNTAPILSLLGGQKTVTTVHSLSYLYFPHAYSLLFRIFYKSLIPRVFRNSDSVITVSESEKSLILKKYAYLKDKLHAIQNGALAMDLLGEVKTKKTFPTSATILFVGSLSKAKNLQGVIEAFNILEKKYQELNLIVVGATGKSFNSVDFGLPKYVKVEFKGQINETRELIELYQKATCLVFPSFYEASPLPPIEAMTCGCPVIVSEIPSLIERCGDAAVYCDPHSPQDIADKIEQVIQDSGLQKNMQVKGYLRAKEFTWEKCARLTFKEVAEVIN